MPEDKSIVSWLPVTMNDLRKHTLASMLFLCLVVISILYTRSEKQNTNQKEDCANEVQELKNEVRQLRNEVTFMQEQARRSDSALADVRATLRELKKYNNIQ